MRGYGSFITDQHYHSPILCGYPCCAPWCATCSILNKLTIEKFDRLVPQLYDVGIESETTLKGIILLVFEKALDEPNFSAMYAQVCERLSEHAPDFEPPDVHQPGSKAPSTFIRLLLQKCQEEFENRSRAEELAAACGSIKDVVPGSEEFRKIMAANAALSKARTKMLGNIKFIGELGKLKLVTEKILHDLIKQLCDRTVDPALEDVECLCELLKTVGALLDHTKAKRLFDQYFGQIAQMREDPGMPARIKFLIDDVTELRENAVRSWLAPCDWTLPLPTHAPSRCAHEEHRILIPLARETSRVSTQNLGGWGQVGDKSF